MEISFYKWFLLILALLLLSSAFSQPPDTVVVYEYIYVTDTVWIDPAPTRDTSHFEKLKPIEEALLVIDSTGKKGNLLTFSLGKSATIPINNIIVSDKQQNLKNMKKITFLGLTFLALNSSLFAHELPKTNFGIYFKANTVFQHPFYYNANWLNKNGSNPTSIFEVTPSLGIRGNFPVSSSISLSPRISYLQMYGMKYDHAFGIRSSDNNHAIVYGLYPDSFLIENGYEQRYKLYSETENLKFHFLSTDLLMNYYFLNGAKIEARIYGGFRVDCLLKQPDKSSITDPNFSDFEKVVFNYCGGVGFDFWNRAFFEIEYSGNINSFAKNDYMRVKYGTASINLGCYLLWPKRH